MKKQFNSKLVSVLDFVLDSLEYSFRLDVEQAQEVLAECLSRSLVLESVEDMASFLLAGQK